MPVALLAVFLAVPVRIRDAVYSLVAEHRRTIFGTNGGRCALPDAVLRRRMGRPLPPELAPSRRTTRASDDARDVMYKKHFTSTALPRLRDAPRPILHRALPIRHLHLGYRRRERIASAFIPAVLRASRLRRGWRRQPLILETQSAPRRIHLSPRTLHARRGGVLLHGRGRGRRGVGVVRRRCGRHPQEHHSNGVVLRERWRCDRDQSRGSVRVGASGVFQTSESAARHRGRAIAVHADRRHFSENGGGNGRGRGGNGREGCGTGRSSLTREVVRGISRRARPRAPRRRLRASEGGALEAPRPRRKFASRLGARAMLRVSPRGSETDEPSAALDGALLVVSFAAERSGATRARRSAAPSEIVGGTGTETRQVSEEGERRERDEMLRSSRRNRLVHATV